MKRKLYSLLTALSLLVVSACDLDLQNDPNAVTVETASLDLVLNRVQLDFVSFYSASGGNGARLTRMINQGSNLYEQAYVPVDYNGLWSNAYANILTDIKFIEENAPKSNFKRHLGIARVMKAYVLMTMVDYFDAVPFSEALDPAQFNPKVDSGEKVYEEALKLLTQAKVDFGGTSVGNPTDMFYANNYANWVKLINTLELKYHLNRKLVKPSESAAAINALITANNFIQPGQEFVFRYGTNLTDPDSRHPSFAGQYAPGGGGDYQSTWYMWHLTEEKGFDDPRARYYLYRQQLVNPTNPQDVRCVGEFAPGHYVAGGFPFCLPGERGYWGRDHLNGEGIPPDGLKRTAYGIYPVGGRFDNNAGQSVSPTAGSGGAGIQPIMLPAFVDFMLAEAALTMTGVAGNPKTLMLSGITKSQNYVRAFSLASSQASVISAFQTDAQFTKARTDYGTYVGAEYDAASANRRMYLVGREYWLSLYGNGNEAYNLYRRTGQPDGMQPGLLANFGVFPRSFFYPNVYVTTNLNAVQKASQGVRVFWDTNPAGNSWVY
jgi:hypothetical protein